MEDDSEEQIELDFPSVDEFKSYDEVDSDEGQAELPADSFDENGVVDEEGCGCA